MSQMRFEQLKAALRFDDPARRDRNDKLAAIRFVVEKFNSVMRDIYKPTEMLTIDEMLIEFHGRASFRQYIPTKPGKFGIKLFWVAESPSALPLQVLVYTGQGTLTDAEKAEHGGHVPALVMRLMSPYLDCGRNLTGDNYFTDLSTANKLANRNTTYIGTLRSNKRCLPNAAKSTENRNRGDSKHFYTNSATICSFWDKGKGPVNVLSTMHGPQRNLGAADGKPDVISSYNQSKSGVDTLDKLVRTYSSKRKYRRWPVHVFFTLIDCGVYVGYKMCSQEAEDQESHYAFKKALAYELCLPLIRRRSLIRGLRKTIKDVMKTVGVMVQEPAPEPAMGRQGRCKHCPRGRDKKTKTVCSRCQRHICVEHQTVICPSCRGD